MSVITYPSDGDQVTHVEVWLENYIAIRIYPRPEHELTVFWGGNIGIEVWEDPVATKRAATSRLRFRLGRDHMRAAYVCTARTANLRLEGLVDV